MKSLKPRRKYGIVAIDVRTITHWISSANIKVVVAMDMFIQFVWALFIMDDNAITLAQAILEHWI